MHETVANLHRYGSHEGHDNSALQEEQRSSAQVGGFRAGMVVLLSAGGTIKHSNRAKVETYLCVELAQSRPDPNSSENLWQSGEEVYVYRHTVSVG